MISFVAVMIRHLGEFNSKAPGRIQLKGSLGGLHGGDVPGAGHHGEQGDHSMWRTQELSLPQGEEQAREHGWAVGSLGLSGRYVCGVWKPV